MTTPANRSYTIGDVSERTGSSTHTLRFHEKEGLFVEPIQRNAAGRRMVSEKEISWLRVGLKLRSTGMPLPTSAATPNSSAVRQPPQQR